MMFYKMLAYCDSCYCVLKGPMTPLIWYFITDTLEWSTPNVYGTIPEPTDSHSACVIQNKMYIFGGFQDSSMMKSQDLYSFDFGTMTWTTVKTKVPIVLLWTIIFYIKY